MVESDCGAYDMLEMGNEEAGNSLDADKEDGGDQQSSQD